MITDRDIETWFRKDKVRCVIVHNNEKFYGMEGQKPEDEDHVKRMIEKQLKHQMLDEFYGELRQDLYRLKDDANMLRCSTTSDRVVFGLEEIIKKIENAYGSSKG